MARLRSGVRYRLKRAPQDGPATPSNDALIWLAALNPAWTRGPQMVPNIEAIARAAHINPVSLLRAAQRDSEISQRMMASLVCACVEHGEKHDRAFSALFELVRDSDYAGAAA
jgi:hypothetical protein